MCTDDIAAKAAEIFTQAGHEAPPVAVTDQRNADGSHSYIVSGRLPGRAMALATGHSPEAVLADLSKELGVEWPKRPLTTWQKEELVRVLNHPHITRAEKTKVLLALNCYTVGEAQAEIDWGKRLINARAGHVVYPDVAEYAVVGSAELVQPVAA